MHSFSEADKKVVIEAAQKQMKKEARAIIKRIAELQSEYDSLVQRTKAYVIKGKNEKSPKWRAMMTHFKNISLFVSFRRSTPSKLQ